MSNQISAVDAMKAKLAEARKNAKAKEIENTELLGMRVELAKIERSLDPQTQAKELANTALDSILAQMDIIADLKVQGAFGYGFQGNKLLKIARTAKFAKGPAKGESMLDSPRGKVHAILAGVNEETLDLVDVYAGSPAYFSDKSLEFVPAVVPSLSLLKSAMTNMALDLGIEADVSTVHHTEIDSMFARSLTKAKQLEINTLKFAEDSELQYED